MQGLSQQPEYRASGLLTALRWTMRLLTKMPLGLHGAALHCMLQVSGSLD